MPNTYSKNAARYAAHLERKRIYKEGAASDGTQSEEHEERTCFTNASLQDKDSAEHRALSDIIYSLSNNMSTDYAYTWTLDYLNHIDDIEPSNIDDCGQEWANECTDVYTHDLTAWLAESNKHLSYMDDALSWTPESADALLSLAQTLARREVVNAVNPLLEKERDYINDPDVCSSSLDENGEPATEGETAHRWDEAADPIECAECGTHKNQ